MLDKNSTYHQIFLKLILIILVYIEQNILKSRVDMLELYVKAIAEIKDIHYIQTKIYKVFSILRARVWDPQEAAD